MDKGLKKKLKRQRDFVEECVIRLAEGAIYAGEGDVKSLPDADIDKLIDTSERIYERTQRRELERRNAAEIKASS